MRQYWIFAPAIAIVLAAGCASLPALKTAAVARQHRASPTVILISIDGYRADYLTRGENPVLERLAADGVRAGWMVPSFPTVTAPNHYTLLTGLYPDHHGIVANEILDRHIQRGRFILGYARSTANPRWWSEGTPLWLSMQRADRRTGEVAWPDGYVKVDGMRPDLHLNGSRVRFPEDITRTAIRWLRLRVGERPQFLMMHYDVVDRIGHRYGPDSPELDAALRKTDANIGRLVTFLRRDHEYATTDVIVVSDHGMAAVPAGHYVYLDNILDPSAVTLVTHNAMASLNPHHTQEGADATAALLAPHAHMRCWRKHDLPSYLHYGHNARIPAIVCIADPGWLITTHSAVAHLKYSLRGEHGYSPKVPSMRALFIAEGPSFRRGYVAPPFPNVDVYPLLTHIFGITPKKNDGSYAAVASMLKPTDAGGVSQPN